MKKNRGKISKSTSEALATLVSRIMQKYFESLNKIYIFLYGSGKISSEKKAIINKGLLLQLQLHDLGKILDEETINYIIEGFGNLCKETFEEDPNASDIVATYEQLRKRALEK